ncbi:hypothetical protein GCM10009716_02180 [Streptomyces sodiiphilus]|uniref:Peptidoglycan binding-like domain-containing protein n=1 Tax=Streptomyces sodiiphilus TaxID=226217 RepID=A0ABP5A317_9ACTN
MLLAIQYELGMADGTANGVFGPGTQAGPRQNTVHLGSRGTWPLLFSAAMVLDQRPDVTFSSVFDNTMSSAVSQFQSFCRLPVSGIGDYQTWASLPVSTGDATRRGTACDGATKITQARADTLKAEGYRYIGRYLTNPSVAGLPEMAIQPGELATIAENGLRVLPIYQTYGNGAQYFSYEQGKAAALAAVNLDCSAELGELTPWQ